jgi:hypothetical protein
MSSFRTLVFRELDHGKAWSVTSHDITLIVRKTPKGYLAFLQKWSVEANAFTMDAVSVDGQEMLFPSREAAEAACQLRYEQELRWMHSRSR